MMTHAKHLSHLGADPQLASHARHDTGVDGAVSGPRARASANTLSICDIKTLLRDRLEELAEDLLGPPNKETRRRQEWRWGTKGSVSLVVRDGSGKRRGAFWSHEAGEGGSPLDLIMHARGCNFVAAIQWAKHWLGEDQGGSAPRPADDATPSKRALKEQADREDEQKRIAYARQLWSEAIPPAGTVAERYLVETRCIPAPPLGWPDSVRFHPSSQSLIVGLTTRTGDVRAVHRVHLTPDARKIDLEEQEQRNLPAIKFTNGVTEDAVVRLPAWTLDAGLDAPILLAEGPETALSAWASSGHETWISCGGFRKLQPEANRRYLVLRDDDRRFSPADNSLRKQRAAWLAETISVRVVTPWPIRRFDKSDLNDVLCVLGPHAVRARIEQALRVRGETVVRQSVTAVRGQLKQSIEQFFTIAARWKTPPACAGMGAASPPVHAIKVDVGAGKSRESYCQVIAMLQRMRAAGDQRPIVFVVPTHKLADEQVRMFDEIVRNEGANLIARVWRGTKVVDPDHPDASDPSISLDRKTKMCRNPEAVKDAQAAGTSMFKSACQRTLEDGERISCPAFALCGYQKQGTSAGGLLDRAARAAVPGQPDHDRSAGRCPGRRGLPGQWVGGHRGKPGRDPAGDSGQAGSGPHCQERLDRPLPHRPVELPAQPSCRRA